MNEPGGKILEQSSELDQNTVKKIQDCIIQGLEEDDFYLQRFEYVLGREFTKDHIREAVLGLRGKHYLIDKYLIKKGNLPTSDKKEIFSSLKKYDSFDMDDFFWMSSSFKRGDIDPEWVSFLQEQFVEHVKDIGILAFFKMLDEYRKEYGDLGYIVNSPDIIFGDKLPEIQKLISSLTDDEIFQYIYIVKPFLSPNQKTEIFKRLVYTNNNLDRILLLDPDLELVESDHLVFMLAMTDSATLEEAIQTDNSSFLNQEIRDNFEREKLALETLRLAKLYSDFFEVIRQGFFSDEDPSDQLEGIIEQIKDLMPSNCISAIDNLVKAKKDFLHTRNELIEGGYSVDMVAKYYKELTGQELTGPAMLAPLPFNNTHLLLTEEDFHKSYKSLKSDKELSNYTGGFHLPGDRILASKAHKDSLGTIWHEEQHLIFNNFAYVNHNISNRSSMFNYFRSTTKNEDAENEYTIINEYSSFVVGDNDWFCRPDGYGHHKFSIPYAYIENANGVNTKEAQDFIERISNLFASIRLPLADRSQKRIILMSLAGMMRYSKAIEKVEAVVDMLNRIITLKDSIQYSRREVLKLLKSMIIGQDGFRRVMSAQDMVEIRSVLQKLTEYKKDSLTNGDDIYSFLESGAIARSFHESSFLNESLEELKRIHDRSFSIEGGSLKELPPHLFDRLSTFIVHRIDNIREEIDLYSNDEFHSGEIDIHLPPSDIDLDIESVKIRKSPQGLQLILSLQIDGDLISFSKYITDLI